MDGARRFAQPVQRLLGGCPRLAGLERVDERVRRLDIVEVPHPFHVALPGEYPEVADEDVLRLTDIVGTTDGQFQRYARAECDMGDAVGVLLQYLVVMDGHVASSSGEDLSGKLRCIRLAVGTA